MDKNPEIVLCGSNYNIIGKNKVVTLPEKNKDIKLTLLKGNCIAHPSVMMRNIVIKKKKLLYNVKAEPAEDYDFWVQLLENGDFYNFRETLLDYRVHNTQVSQKRKTQQLQSSLKTRLKMLQYLDYSFEAKEYDLLKKTIDETISLTFNEIKEFFVLKRKMIWANSNHFFDTNGFEDYLTDLQNQNLIKYFVSRERYHPILLYHYWLLKKEHDFNLVVFDKIKLIIKSIVFYRP